MTRSSAWLTRGAELLELRVDGSVAVPRPGRPPAVYPDLRAFLRAAPASNGTAPGGA